MLDSLKSDSRFSTLVSAIIAADIDQSAIDDIAPITIFAPTNDAFNKISNTVLATLLSDQEDINETILRHVVPEMRLSTPGGKKEKLSLYFI